MTPAVCKVCGPDCAAVNCPSCGALAHAVYRHEQQVTKRRRVEWFECDACRERERELGDERAQEAIREAERSGV